jgi:hypothetical protein
LAGAGLAAAALALATVSSNAANVHHKAFRLRKPSVAPTACATNASKSFVGIPGLSNVAGGDQSAVLGGNSNQACGPSSALGAGQDNLVDYDSEGSFLATGYLNRIGFSGNDNNPVFSFIGGGAFNEVTGAGDFIGGGGTAFNPNFSGSPVIYGNQISGIDSFVGGGDANDVSGNGSFIGAGGYAYANGGATSTGNSISGADSFIGAGDQNEVAANQSFVGSGAVNVVTSGADGSFIGAGNNNSDANQFDAIAGGQSNGINAIYGYIGGGSANGISLLDGSTVEANGASYGAIAGGSQNLIDATVPSGAQYAFIGGGSNNTVTGTYGTIAGGEGSAVGGEYASVAGGYHNNATGAAAAVGGGSESSATGHYATIPGGYLNAANGTGSFAAGTQAKARHNGAFVWSDNAGTAALQSTAAYQFVARASGGFYLFTNAAESSGAKLSPGSGTWASQSDRAMKTGVIALDESAILAKVAALPVSEWSYISERGVRHIGPMAQDFYAAFKVGEDDRHITTIDEDGVALAAVKAVHAENEAVHAENQAVRADDRALRADDRALRASNAKLQTEIDALRRQVAALARR